MSIQFVVLDYGFLQSGGMCLKSFSMCEITRNTAEFPIIVNGPKHGLEVASA
jgi:hypothetical protein